MRREFLRGLGISEDIIPEIINVHHDSLRELKQEAEAVEGLKAQIEQLNEEMKARDAQIETLKGAEGLTEELKTKLKEYEDINAGYGARFDSLQLNNEVLKLVARDAVNADQVIKLLDIEGLDRDEAGRFIGLEDKVTQFKEANPHLFAAAQQERAGFPPRKVTSEEKGMTVDEFKALSTSELTDLYTNDPETFKTLSDKI